MEKEIEIELTVEGDDGVFSRTDNPLLDFERYDAELERKLEKQPICSECGEYITDDMCFQINDELICDNCINNYRVFTEYFVKGL